MGQMAFIMEVLKLGIAFKLLVNTDVNSKDDKGSKHEDMKKRDIKLPYHLMET